MEHTINPSRVQTQVQSARTDEIKTRFNIHIYSASADITGPWMSKSYKNFALKSLYGIYDRSTDKMRIYIPYSTALSLLLH